MRWLLAGTMALGLVLGCALPGNSAEDENKFPDAVRRVLDQAESIELFSLDPEAGNEKPKIEFHGWKVLGSTIVKAKAEKSKSLEAVYKGVRDAKGGSFCFDPRHGVRAKHDGKMVDLLICFECGHVYVYVDGKRGENVSTDGSPEATLDMILKEAKIPLAPKPKAKK